MREINGIVYYTIGDVSAYTSRSKLTISQYVILSDFREQEHGQRFIPQPVRVNGQRLFTKEQVREIKRFTNTKKGGDLARAKKEYEAKKKAETKKEKKQSWATDRRNKRDL